MPEELTPLAMAETDNFLRANIIDTVTYTQSIHNNSDLQVGDLFICQGFRGIRQWPIN